MVNFVFFISVVLLSANGRGILFFFNKIVLNSETQVSDQGPSTLGAGIKELRRLTNLSLDLRYFNLKFPRVYERISEVSKAFGADFCG